ncbi:MAG: ATP-binding cassette domain-containing protein [Mycoplasmatales bacterium]|nr:ATP-binding cassette domain-containing protein [Mycoplasmatales bacterium]
MKNKKNLKDNVYPFLFEGNLNNSLDKIEFLMPNIQQNDVPFYPENISKAWNTKFSFGGYGEKRFFYKDANNKSAFFHTGIDLFVKDGTKLLSPFNGKIIASFWSGNRKFIYGSGSGTQITLIVKKEEIANKLGQEKADKICEKNKFLRFHFIHLSKINTNKIYSNKLIKKSFKKHDKKVIFPKNFTEKNVSEGEVIGFVGKREENGGWVPHVHLEIYKTNSYLIFNDFKEKYFNSPEKNFFSTGTINGSNKDDFNKFVKNSNSINPDKIFNFKSNSKKMEMKLSDSMNYQRKIQVIDLNLTINKTKILKNINFAINAQEFLVILGPSGSGKSSILNSIANLHENKKGTILIDGENKNENIGYVLQNYSLYPTISIFKNIYLSIKNSKIKKIKCKSLWSG